MCAGGTKRKNPNDKNATSMNNEAVKKVLTANSQKNAMTWANKSRRYHDTCRGEVPLSATRKNTLAKQHRQGDKKTTTSHDFKTNVCLENTRRRQEILVFTMSR